MADERLQPQLAGADRLLPAPDPGDTGFCKAVSQHGTPLTVYIGGRAFAALAKPGRDPICTQDPGHEGGHAACDGEGRILARWPRRDVERYWQPGDCEGHDHG